MYVACMPFVLCVCVRVCHNWYHLVLWPWGVVMWCGAGQMLYLYSNISSLKIILCMYSSWVVLCCNGK